METGRTCTSCARTLRGGFLGDKVFTCEFVTCQNDLCKNCNARRPLFVPKSSDDRNNLNAGSVKRLCPTCFQAQSTLNFDATYDYQPSTSGTTFVFAHGASGCRKMFTPYAEYLYLNHQHGYLLLDLPGHGACVDTPLSLDSCVETTREALKACRVDDLEKLVYVGGSLGAYVGFYVLQEMKDRFKGAVLMDCGQNVGPGCGIAAKIGLVVLKMIAENSSNCAMMNLMLSVTKKSKADYHLVDCVFGAGMWFDQASAHIACLREVAPARIIPNIPLPILYMNGSKDHRDSENTWLDLSAEKSSLKVYDDGDHFFSHDTRFVDDIFAKIVEFEKTV